MTVATIAFFNNKGGVGKTSLLYHVAHAMAAFCETKVLVADFDPQSNLTSFFLSDEKLDTLWTERRLDDRNGVETVHSALQPLVDGEGGLKPVTPLRWGERLWLLPGDLSLSEFEDELSAQWPRCLNGERRAFTVTCAFHSMIQQAAEAVDAQICFLDVGPNLGAINRSALVASDFIVVPMGADLFSNRGIRNLGPKLAKWRSDWAQRIDQAPANMKDQLPTGRMLPLGFTLNVFNVYAGEPVRAFAEWMNRAPGAFAESVGRNDPQDRLSDIPNYQSLMPYAQRARKPIFELRTADGVRGSHLNSARECGEHMVTLAAAIRQRIRQLA
ncbi:MAG: ParA family protein [Hyphomonadaceae bacterium]